MIFFSSKLLIFVNLEQNIQQGDLAHKVTTIAVINTPNSLQIAC